MMAIELEGMAIEMPRVAGHPNRVGFRGVLTVLDEASDKPPAGARGHRVVLTRKAAEEALPSLLGMGVGYAPSLDRHDTRRKVGVITQAEIVGKNVELSGYLFGKDFPELVHEMKKAGGRASSCKGDPQRLSARGSAAKALGMSYEIANARIADVRAKVWILTHVTFTGAAILWREKAAYGKTWIELD
jgi:hypothetical protein